MDAGCYCLNILRYILGEPGCALSATAVTSPEDPGLDLDVRATLRCSDKHTGRLSLLWRT